MTVTIGTGSGVVDLSNLMIGGVAASKIMVGTGSSAVEAWTAFTPVSLSDDFNRANGLVTTPWTSYWDNATYKPEINGNIYRIQNNGTAGTNYAYSIHDTVLASDNQYVQATIQSTNNTWPSWISLGSNSDGSSKVNLRWTDTTIDIVNRVAGSETTLASVGGQTQAAGKTFRLEVQGNVYKGYVNGSQVLTYTDSGGVITRGATRRYVGLGATRRQASFIQSWSPYLDDWSAGDL